MGGGARLCCGAILVLGALPAALLLAGVLLPRVDDVPPRELPEPRRRGADGSQPSREDPPPTPAPEPPPSLGARRLSFERDPEVQVLLRKLPASGPVPDYPEGLRSGRVELFPRPACGGDPIVVNGLHGEERCGRCFSLCQKKFPNGGAAHGNFGSRVMSWRIVGDMDAWAYSNCLGFGWGLDRKKENFLGKFSASHGCMTVVGNARFDHLSFSPAGEPEWTAPGLEQDATAPRLPPTALARPPDQRPRLPDDAPTATPRGEELPYFDLSLGPEERAGLVRGEISRLEGEARSAADEQTLGLLRILARDWGGALGAFDDALAKDPRDLHVHTLRGHALTGLAWCAKDPRGNLTTIRRAFHAAWTHGMSDWGSDTEVLDVHFGGRNGEVYARVYPSDDVHRQACAEVVGDMVAYWELQRLLRGVRVPSLLSLPNSRGTDPWTVGGTLSESVSRFEAADIVLLKEAIPKFIAVAVRDYYRRFWGKCSSEGIDRPVHCDPPERPVFGVNANDPLVNNAHSDRVGYFLNQYLRPLVEAFAGRQVSPVYSYYVRYLDKPDGLQPHTDMVDNEYSLSMQVDYTPEERGPCGIYVWKKRLPFLESARNLESMCPHAHDEGPGPAYCETPGDSVGGALQLGDALLFRGRQHIHYRPRWRKGRTCAALIGHYVTREFEGDRSAHNRMVCCAWPPLPDYNYELCRCEDGHLRKIQGRLRELIPL